MAIKLKFQLSQSALLLYLSRVLHCWARCLICLLLFISRMTYPLATPESSGRLSTSIQRQDIRNRLGNFRELQLVDISLGNRGPIITNASYPNDPRNQITERLCSVSPKFLEWPIVQDNRMTLFGLVILCLIHVNEKMWYSSLCLPQSHVCCHVPV